MQSIAIGNGLVGWRISLLSMACLGLFSAAASFFATELRADLPCGTDSCDRVQTSEYAYLFGVPISVLGLLAYVFLAFIAIRSFQGLLGHRLQSTAIFITLAGTLASAYLVYISIFVLFETCLICLLSAASMAISLCLFALVNFAEGPPSRPPLRVASVLCPFISLGLALVVVLPTVGKRAYWDVSALNNARYRDLVPIEIEPAKVSGSIVVLFIDPFCPVCHRESPEIISLASRRAGVCVRFFPLPTHPGSREAAVLAEVARRKGKLQQLLAECKSSHPMNLLQFGQCAKHIGIRREEITGTDVALAQARVREDLEFARKIKLKVVPFVILLESDGSKLIGQDMVKTALRRM